MIVCRRHASFFSRLHLTRAISHAGSLSLCATANGAIDARGCNGITQRADCHERIP
jgi:hypothetical protein